MKITYEHVKTFLLCILAVSPAIFYGIVLTHYLCSTHPVFVTSEIESKRIDEYSGAITVTPDGGMISLPNRIEYKFTLVNGIEIEVNEYIYYECNIGDNYTYKIRVWNDSE